MLLRITFCVLILGFYGCQSTKKGDVSKLIEKTEQKVLAENTQSNNESPGDLKKKRSRSPFPEVIDSQVLKKSWGHIKWPMSKRKKRGVDCDICHKDYTYYKSLNSSVNSNCIVNDKHAIVTTTTAEHGTVVSVFSSFDRTKEDITIDFSKIRYAFSVSKFNKDMMISFEGLYKNYLFIDTDTSKGLRGLYVINLDSGKTIFEEEAIDKASFNGTVLTYYGISNKPAKEVCTQKKDIENYAVSERIKFDVTTQKYEKTGAFKCYSAQ